ncbi:MULTISPECIES: hypothetical protein [Lactobacillus]|uniref:Uncharacterized protein n=1 Tax=Lactobacillus xujianguonis TaxID=2495899 RepID=A0A437SXX4_9LACO|nr:MULTISPECIES: hypothetical protein [Lactobacillus]RVU71769.1 hypothetical protein EJK17_00385 [Lactobacillus xujianguonis]
MVEETQTSTPTVEENKNWQDKANEMKKQVGNGLFVQLAYRSDEKHDCEPVLLSEKQDFNRYPIVVDVPTGLTSPKFNWSTGKWLENSTSGVANQLAKIKDRVEAIQQQQDESAKAKTAESVKNDQLTKMVTMIAGQLGTLSADIKSLKATPTPATTATPKEGE